MEKLIEMCVLSGVYVRLHKNGKQFQCILR